VSSTLEDVLKRVLRFTQQDPNISAISDSDDTQYLVDRINEAIDNVRELNPPAFVTRSTITATATNRLFALATDVDPFEIDPKSFRDTTATPDRKIDYIDYGVLEDKDPNFQNTQAGVIQAVYFEGSSLGVWPILTAGSSSVTIQYEHPANLTRLTALANTIPIPDSWVLYLEKFAIFYYQADYKVIGNAMVTKADVDEQWAKIVAKMARYRRLRLRGYRQLRGA